MKVDLKAIIAIGYDWHFVDKIEVPDDDDGEVGNSGKHE